jgi:hypothetical protein
VLTKYKKQVKVQNVSEVDSVEKFGRITCTRVAGSTA